MLAVGGCVEVTGEVAARRQLEPVIADRTLRGREIVPAAAAFSLQIERLSKYLHLLISPLHTPCHAF